MHLFIIIEKEHPEKFFIYIFCSFVLCCFDLEILYTFNHILCIILKVLNKYIFSKSWSIFVSNWNVTDV